MASGEEHDKEPEALRILRLSDIAEEPLGMLMPIEGYEEVPTVPLETAVKPLVPLLPSIVKYAYVAKQRCKDPPPDGLTVDESASIMLYSMGWQPHHKCLYVALNATLRSKTREKLEPWFLYLKLFLTALSRLPSTHQHVYRGVKLALSEQYQLGKTVIWWGFSSCTTSINVLQSELFAGKKGRRTIFNIDCQSGKDIRKHSYFASEEEIILLPATQFTVVGSFDAGHDLYQIQLKETPLPFPLLQPILLSTIINESLPNSDGIAADATGISDGINNVNPKKLQNTDKKTSDTSANNFFSKLSSLFSISKGSKKTASEPLPPAYTNTELQQMIEKNKMQQYVDLRNKGLTDDDMQLITYYLLRNNMTLTVLNLSNNQISNEGLKHLSDTLKTNKTLTYLYLSNNQISAQGVQYLINTLQINMTLTYIDLCKNHIDDQGVQYLCNILPKNKTLKILDLRENQIGPQGVKYLTDTLKNNKTISRLSLRGNPIGSQGKQLLDGLKKNNPALNLEY